MVFYHTSEKSTAQGRLRIRKYAVLPAPFWLKYDQKISPYASMGRFFQPISSQKFIGKTASHRKSANFVRSRGTAAQACCRMARRRNEGVSAKFAFYGACFLMWSRPKRCFFIPSSAAYPAG